MAKLKNKKVKLTPKIKKAFMLTSIMNAIIAEHHNGNPRLTLLQRQCNAAMRVFNVKAGSKIYNALAYQMQDIWEEVDRTHETALLIDEIPVAVEMFYNLLPKNDMKAFLNMHYTTNTVIRDSSKSALLCLVREMDRLINEALGTEETITRDELGAVMCKPVKVKKAKRKKKEPSKAYKWHMAEVERHRKRKEMFRGFIKKRVAKAKADKEKALTARGSADGLEGVHNGIRTV